MAELTSAVIGLAGVCLQSYKLVSDFVKTIRQMGHDVADLDDRFTEERTRLRVFIEAHNLLATQTRGGDTRPSPGTTMPADWETAILARFVKIEEHFANVQKVMKLYVETPPGNEPPEPKVTKTARTFSTWTSSSQLPPPELLNDLKVETEARSRRISLIQASKFKRKIEWSIRYKSQLTNAIDKLQEDNDALFRLSQPALLALIAEGVSSLIRPRLDAHDSPLVAKGGSGGGGDINTVQNYHSEREFYKRLMREKMEARGLLDRLDKETEEQKLVRQMGVDRFPELSDSSLSPDPSTRTLTPYYRTNRGTGAGGGEEEEEEEEVLVEWREYQTSTGANHLQRISNVVAILNARPASLANAILPSPGFFEYKDTKGGDVWLGIAYQTPPRAGYHPRHWTLRDLLTRPPASEKKRRSRGDNGSNDIGVDFWKPPLGDRFRLAHRLAETLLAIHTCNWLHKGLRPENIVFFGRGPSPAGRGKSVAEPYLLGWGYARSYDRWGDTERTAAAASWTNQEILYREPDSFAFSSEEEQDEPSVSSGDATTLQQAPTAAPRRPRYRIEFDQYQLGCLLLEIGKWDLLGTLRDHALSHGRNNVFPDGEDHNRAWRSYLLGRAERLKTDMGEIYANVTISLLKGLNREGEEEKEFWRDVVLALSQCRA